MEKSHYMSAVLWSVVLCALHLQLCEAVNLKCTATCRESRMIYSIDGQGFPPDVDLSSCHFSWDNGSTILASHQGKLPSVKRKSLIVLETTECFMKVVYQSDCESKTTARLTNFRANCSTSCCKVIAPLVLVGIIVPILVGLCMAAVGGYFLYKRYKSREENHRDPWCRSDSGSL